MPPALPRIGLCLSLGFISAPACDQGGTVLPAAPADASLAERDSGAPLVDSATPVEAAVDAAAPTTTQTLLALGATPCGKTGDFLCVTLPVPLDHGGSLPGRTIGVTFAVHPAPPATRRGVLVTAVGGPGYAGIGGMVTWASLSPRFPAEFDVVYFDLRGVGRSGGLGCPSAAQALYLGGLRVADAADEATLDAKAQAFALACPAEMGVAPSDLPFYSTAQAVEDLEAFRVTLGEPMLTLYGLSYGTQFMQTYAAAHPSRVRALVLDGTVNLALSHIAYMSDLTADIDGLLARTLADCAGRPACAPHFAKAPGATALERVTAAYGALAATLDTTPVVVGYPLHDGGVSPRDFGRADLDTTTFNAMYDPTTRGGFEVAMAPAFQKGDWLPMLSLSYRAAGIDGQTAGPVGTADADPGMSDAIYYTVTCNDYGLDAPTAAERKAMWLSAGRALWGKYATLSPFYGDYPCVYWPATHAATPAAPLTLPGVLTLIIGATGDGAVPVDQGQAVAASLSDGYQIVVDGGQHVMYGRGLPCVDDPASALLLDGARPAQRLTACAGTFVQ